MKKIGFIFLTFLTLVLTSCNEQKIVGSWVYKQTESEGTLQTNLKGTITFASNGTGSERAQCYAQSVEYIDGVSVLIKMTCSCMGEFEWSLKDDNIVMSPVAADITNVTYKMYDNETNEFLGELTGSDLDDVLDEMKEEMMKATTEKILMQQEKKSSQSTMKMVRKQLAHTIGLNKLNRQRCFLA